MGQSTTDGKALESSDIEQDIAQALAESAPLRDHCPIDFAPLKVRAASSQMTSYLEHPADVDQIGKLNAESVAAQYEGAVKALEELGTTLVDCVKRAETMAAGCKDAIAYVQDTAEKYREEAKLIFDRIEQASVLTAEVRSVCDEMRRKMKIEKPPMQSA